jgi:lipoprotein-anchoring transpeptidase ErfK/SrfK
MVRSLVPLLALLAIAALTLPVAAQTNVSQAAEAAEQVAARADGTFEQIDPDAAFPQADAATQAYAGLPPLMPESDAPRGPAVRMIAEPVVQPLPAAPAQTLPSPTPVALASNDPFVIKSILPIEGSIRYGDWFWDESAAPRAGKLVITVDLEARVISAFRDGHEIGTAVALLGTQSHPTPLGTFPILTKEKDNVSEKYNNAPMPHTLRLTWDGIAIHGSVVLNGYASHGCIAVPDEFAAKLFAAAKRGDKVIITRGKVIGIGDKVM